LADGRDIDIGLKSRHPIPCLCWPMRTSGAALRNLADNAMRHAAGSRATLILDNDHARGWDGGPVLRRHCCAGSAIGSSNGR
jgi:hypothetical protein